MFDDVAHTDLVVLGFHQKIFIKLSIEGEPERWRGPLKERSLYHYQALVL